MMYGGGGWGMHRSYRDNDSQPKVPLTAAGMRRIFRYIVPYWPHEIVILICVLAVTGLGLIPPLLMRSVIDTAIPDKTTDCSTCSSSAWSRCRSSLD